MSRESRRPSETSQRDDVTLANPFGSAARGWGEVEKTLDLAAAQVREGEPIRYERISEYATADPGYDLEFERTRAKVGGSDKVAPFSLRVTNVYRQEDGNWKLAHRHADPLTSPQPPESVLD